MFEPIKTRRLADEIATRIRHMILEGSLRPGDRLPAERLLADQFDTSRPTIRDALMVLETEGLLQMQRGGLQVVDATQAPIRDPLTALFHADESVFSDYLEFRSVIEGAAAGFAAHRATEIDRQNLKEVFEEILHCHELHDPVREARADAEFHIAIYEACHNLTILHIMRGMAELLRNDVFFNRSTLYPRTGYRDSTLAQHKAIYDAIMIGEPTAARGAAIAHIDFVREALIELKKSDERLGVAQRRKNVREEA